LFFVEGREINGLTCLELIFIRRNSFFFMGNRAGETIVGGHTHTKHTIKINSSQLNLLFH